MTWNANTPNNNLVSRDVAKTRIIAMAQEEGYTGAFKVFNDGVLVADPSTLPEQVDMSKITLSEVLDQA